MEQNNKKTLIIAGAAIIVVIALAIILPHLKKTVEAPTITPGAETVVPGTTSATPTKSSTGSTSATTAAYNAELKAYEGKSIVFGSDCTALPNDQVQALGTKILLVNNSNVSHTIIFGNNSGVTIPGYHYKTAIVANSDVIVVSCDANQKAATVTVK